MRQRATLVNDLRDTARAATGSEMRAVFGTQARISSCRLGEGEVERGTYHPPASATAAS